MKLHTLLMVGLGFGLTGCAEKEYEVAPDSVGAGTETFVRHMHYHAQQLERINAALAADNLDAARTPAYWLAAHEQLEGAADEWQPYVNEMRNAARAVSDAPNLETARTETQRIVESCEGCHANAGVEIPTLVLKDE